MKFKLIKKFRPELRMFYQGLNIFLFSRNFSIQYVIAEKGVYIKKDKNFGIDYINTYDKKTISLFCFGRGLFIGIVNEKNKKEVDKVADKEEIRKMAVIRYVETYISTEISNETLFDKKQSTKNMEG